MFILWLCVCSPSIAIITFVIILLMSTCICSLQVWISIKIYLNHYSLPNNRSISQSSAVPSVYVWDSLDLCDHVITIYYCQMLNTRPLYSIFFYNSVFSFHTLVEDVTYPEVCKSRLAPSFKAANWYVSLGLGCRLQHNWYRCLRNTPPLRLYKKKLKL